MPDVPLHSSVADLWHTIAACEQQGALTVRILVSARESIERSRALLRQARERLATTPPKARGPRGGTAAG